MKLGLQLSFLTSLQIIISFCIQWYVVAELGMGSHTDALYAGLTVPQIAMVLGTDSLVFVLVPFLAKRSESQMESEVWQLLAGLGLLFAGIAIVIAFAAPMFVPWIVPGFSYSNQQLTVSLTRIQAFGIVGAALNAVLCSYCQARNRFVLPAAAILFSYLAGWLILFWGLDRYGVRLAAWVQVFVLTGPAVVLFRSLSWKGKFSLEPKLFKELYSGTRPILLTAAYGRVGSILDRILASFLAPGSLVALDLAQRTMAAVSRILTQGIVTPIIPILSRLANANDWDHFTRLYRKKAIHSFVVSAALVLGLALAIYSLQLPFMDKLPFGAALRRVESIWITSLFMCGVLLCAGFNHTLTSAYYSMGNTETPNKVAALCYTLGMVLKVGGFYAAGLKGIAFALSVQYATNSLILIWMDPGSKWKGIDAEAVGLSPTELNAFTLALKSDELRKSRGMDATIKRTCPQHGHTVTREIEDRS